jgi:hypothetical protein
VTDIKCFAAIDRVLFYDDDSCDAPWTVNPTGNTCYYCQELLAVVDAKLLSPGLALDGNGGGLIGAKRMKWYQVMEWSPRCMNVHLLLASSLESRMEPCCMLCSARLCLSIGFKVALWRMDLV